ncbi:MULTISPECIES: hypothetical protein [unclassified Variovorax]|uniref:hypothetical protein n=1 Tax=unclassified Variovorax TaxID=663243 RepID=UPI003ECEDFF7
MRIKLIEDLPMATSAELYQLSWVIEQLLADPRRVVQARSQLHLGQQVQYLHWGDGKWRTVRVVSMKNDRVTVLDEANNKHLSLPYAAIMTTESATANTGEQASAPSKPTPPPEIPRRENFRVGQRVSFADQGLQRHIGQITRINQRTATIHCDGRAWRVGFAFLQHITDVTA